MHSQLEKTMQNVTTRRQGPRNHCTSLLAIHRLAKTVEASVCLSGKPVLYEKWEIIKTG